MQFPIPQATVLGQGTRIEGDLHLNHDAVFGGELTGSLRVDGTIELTRTARIGGDVVASHIKLAGHVEGDVTAHEQVDLLADARLDGGITTARLTVAEGVTFDGQLRIQPEGTVAHEADPPEDIYVGRRERLSKRADAFGATGESEADAFAPVPGTVNAGLRPRRRQRVAITPLI